MNNVRGSIVVSIPACHAGNRGSIPRRGVTFFFFLVLSRRLRVRKQFFPRWTTIRKYKFDLAYEGHLKSNSFTRFYWQIILRNENSLFSNTNHRHTNRAGHRCHSFHDWSPSTKVSRINEEQVTSWTNRLSGDREKVDADMITTRSTHVRRSDFSRLHVSSCYSDAFSCRLIQSIWVGMIYSVARILISTSWQTMSSDVFSTSACCRWIWDENDLSWKVGN